MTYPVKADQKINQHLQRVFDARFHELLTMQGRKRSITTEAQLAGVNRGTWITFRSGYSNFATDRLFGICKNLGIPFHKLWKNADF